MFHCISLTGFWISLWFRICQAFEYTKVLNTPGLHGILNMGPWICLNVGIHLLLYKQQVYKQLALGRQIAKQLSGLKSHWLKWSFSFAINVKQLLNWQYTKIQLSLKDSWEHIKITDHTYRFWILKITVFFRYKGYLVKLLSSH